MSSVRDLKKDVIRKMSTVVDEAYSYMLYYPNKKDEQADAIIDEAADYLNEALPSITRASRSKNKVAELREIRAASHKRFEDLLKRVRAL